MSSDLWEVRDVPGGLALELQAGDDPGLVLVQSENRVRVGLADVKGGGSAAYRRRSALGAWAVMVRIASIPAAPSMGGAAALCAMGKWPARCAR